MAFSRTQLIAYVLLVFINPVASVTFNFTNIRPHNQNGEIVMEGVGAKISDDGIQLTPDKAEVNQTGKAGRATYFKLLHLWDRKSGKLASFTTNFTFVIDSEGLDYFGDGLTFFIAQNNSEIYPGGSMGLPVQMPNSNNTTFVAIEFDTFWNRLWDPLDSSNISIGHHVGISISSLESDQAQKWLSNVPGGGVCQAWVAYDSYSRNLSVSFTGFKNSTTFRQDGLHSIIDLRQVLPEWVIFGFSASTGSLFQKNNVRSWTFRSSDLPGDENTELPPPIPSPDPVKPSKIGLMVGLIVGISVGITFMGVLAFVLWRKNKKNRKEVAEDIGFDVKMNNEFQMGSGPKRFSYYELARSTGDFSETEKLGEGGFGGVYRGFLKDSESYVAVKRVSKNSKQGIQEYASEVMIISRLRHRNLVQLEGWCHEKGNLLLVYEYMENEA
ncbi:L-type lectin-domain containing receptor kinase IX.1-like protein [Tanacetum coccineum]